MDITITINNENEEKLNLQDIPEENEIDTSPVEDDDSGEEKEEAKAMFRRRMTYICAPYYPKEDTPENRKELLLQTQKACECVTLFGQIPISPSLYFLQFLKGEYRYELAHEYGLGSVPHCSYLVVVGDYISSEMIAEINRAERIGIPILHLKDPIDTRKGIMELLQSDTHRSEDKE